MNIEQAAAIVRPMNDLIRDADQKIAEQFAEMSRLIASLPSVAEHNALKRKVAAMTSALQQCEDYLDGRADVVDGSYGEPSPNAEMSLLSEVQEALGKGGY